MPPGRFLPDSYCITVLGVVFKNAVKTGGLTFSRRRSVRICNADIGGGVTHI